MEGFIAIILIFILFLIAYRVIRVVIDSDFRKNIISGELKNESSKMTFKIRDWFVWNVQVNNEKGTAGGNIKVNFPIKSALAISIICLIVAIVAENSGVSLVVTLIFLSFAIYHFKKWYKTLKIISAHEAFENIKQLKRTSESKIIGGICAGIHKHYKISLFIIRLIFISLGIIGVGIYIYILLWLIIPMESSKIQGETKT